MSRIRANQITNKGANGAPNFPNGLTATGIITATISNSTLGTLAVTGNATIDGNLGVGGTITYEDVARVDATGISTFREGFKVGPLSGIGLTAYKDGSIRSSGIITATTYYGSGSNLTGIDATQIVTGNTSVQTVDTGSDGHVKVTTEGSERLRIDNGGRLHIGATTGPSNSKLSVTGTDATNYITLKNTTASDSSGARKSIIVFQGTRSGGEVTDLVHIAGQHDGGADNDYGAFRVLVNNGSGVTERFGIGQGGEVRVNAQIGSAGQVLQSAGGGSPAVWANAPLVAYKAKHYRRARYSYSSSSWTELDSNFRISHTPAAIGNTIIATVQLYGSISDGTYGGWTIVTDQGSSSDESMIGEMQSSGTIGRGSILGGTTLQEMYRSTNGGNMWMGQHLWGFHVTENTNAQTYKVFGRMGNGTRYIGDNQPAQFMQIWEYRGDVTV